eukprot:tig00000448_g853.t1
MPLGIKLKLPWKKEEGRAWNSTGPASRAKPGAKTHKTPGAKTQRTMKHLLKRSKLNPLLGFKGMDAFEFAPQYQYAVVRTQVGAFLTVLCAFLLLAFIGYTLNDFVRGNISKTTTTLATTPEQQVVVNAASYLALAIETERDANAYDPSIFTVSFRETTQLGPVSSNRTRVNRQLGLLTNCSVPDRPDASPYYLCPAIKNTGVQGQFKDLTYRYVRVQVALCSGRPECKNITVIRQAVVQLKYTIWLYYEDYDSELRESTVHAFTRRYFVVPEVAHSIDLLVAPRRVTISPRIYLDGVDRVYNLSMITETTMTAQGETWVPGAPILTFFLRMNDVYVRDAYTPYSFPQMFGDWGALWTAVSLTLGALAFQYNQWVFERAVKKHLGRRVDFRSLFALDIKLADVSFVDKAGAQQSQAEIRERLKKLRNMLAAEVRDEKGTHFEYSEAMTEVHAQIALNMHRRRSTGRRGRAGSVFQSPYPPGDRRRASMPYGAGAGWRPSTGYSTPEEGEEEPAARARRRWKKVGALIRLQREGDEACYEIGAVPRGAARWLAGPRPDPAMVFASPEEKLAGIEALVQWPSPPMGSEEAEGRRGGGPKRASAAGSASGSTSGSGVLAPPVAYRGGGEGAPPPPPPAPEPALWSRLTGGIFGGHRQPQPQPQPRRKHVSIHL